MSCPNCNSDQILVTMGSCDGVCLRCGKKISHEKAQESRKIDKKTGKEVLRLYKEPANYTTLAREVIKYFEEDDESFDEPIKPPEFISPQFGVKLQPVSVNMGSIDMHRVIVDEPEGKPKTFDDHVADIKKRFIEIGKYL